VFLSNANLIKEEVKVDNYREMFGLELTGRGIKLNIHPLFIYNIKGEGTFFINIYYIKSTK